MDNGCNDAVCLLLVTLGVCLACNCSKTELHLLMCHLQNFSGTGYSGLVYDAPEQLRDYSVKGKWRIPINMHIGNMGLSPKTGGPLITAPPMRTGGNIDNKRIGIGGTVGSLCMHVFCYVTKVY